jgi:hypothetical protein
MLQFYLAATQFALGDLPAPTTPSAKLTPAIRAQEQLDWRLGLAPSPPSLGMELSVFETIDRAAKAGLLYIGGSDRQKVSADIAKSFDEQLNNDEVRQIRLKLDEAGVRLLTYRVERAPSGEADWRRIFEFARKMGAEALVSRSPGEEMLGPVERLCEEHAMSFAVAWSREQEILKMCQGHSKRLGAHVNFAFWMEFCNDIVAAVRTLGDRLIVLQVQSRRSWIPSEVGACLEEIHKLNVKPVMFSIEPPSEGAVIDIGQSITHFNQLSRELAK